MSGEEPRKAYICQVLQVIHIVGRLLSEQGCVETRKGNNQEKTQRDPENTDAESTLSNNHKAQLLVPILQMQRPRPEEEK